MRPNGSTSSYIFLCNQQEALRALTDLHINREVEANGRSESDQLLINEGKCIGDSRASRVQGRELRTDPLALRSSKDGRLT